MGLANQVKLAENLLSIEKNGGTIQQAFIDAGYSPATAANGLDAVPDGVMKLLGEKGSAIAKLGRASVKEMKEIAVGRLVSNCVEGTDKGALSAKILGSHRELNLWQPDNATGLIVLQIPQTVQTMSDEERNQLLAPPKE